MPMDSLQYRLESDDLGVNLELEEGTEDSWTSLRLYHEDPEAPGDGTIAAIERNPVEEGSLGEGELAEFIDEVKERKPETASRWLQDYLPDIKTIYCIQVIHKGAEWGRGWNAIHAVQSEIFEALGGICQADYEGFSNDDGYHILWQFSDKVEGPWQMAVLNAEGHWESFEMDLGNMQQREAFWRGQVPPGARRL